MRSQDVHIIVSFNLGVLDEVEHQLLEFSAGEDLIKLKEVLSTIPTTKDAYQFFVPEIPASDYISMHLVKTLA